MRWACRGGRGDFALFHHVLSRASWSSLAVSRVLLEQLVPTGPLRLAIDETLERRRGEKIEALGVYRDPVRSSHGHFVKAKGLRWVSLMLLAEIPWAHRVWALPFLTVPAPSRHYHEAQGRLRRWLPDRELVVVGDRTYATLKLLAACQGMDPPITFLTRLRLDAVLHDPPPPRQPGQLGRPRVVEARQPSLQARLADPATVWTDLRQRWQVEAAFQEVRTHLGVGPSASGRWPPSPAPPRSCSVSRLAHPGRPSPAPGASPPPPSDRLVCQDRPHLRRHPGGDPPGPLDAGPAFFAVPGHPRHPKTPPAAPPAPLLAALCYSA